jgi:hypothetical protein
MISDAIASDAYHPEIDDDVMQAARVLACRCCPFSARGHRWIWSGCWD